MKHLLTKIIVGTALLAAGSHNGWAQGTFQNLAFESATIVLDPLSPYYPYAAYATNALPGWWAIGMGPDVLYNSVTLGTPAISIHDANDRGMPPIQGAYSVYLQDSYGHIALAQTGRIPSSAQSLTFWSSYPLLQVTFAGQTIAYVQIGTGPNYDIFGGDIAAFAGQTGELRFSGSGILDNILFSDRPVPEPGAVTLCGLGALLFGWRGWRRRGCGFWFQRG